MLEKNLRSLEYHNRTMLSIDRNKVVHIVLTVLNALVIVSGLLFFNWNGNEAICYYWMEIWLFAFFNIFKGIKMAASGGDSFGCFFLIMFGVVGLSITNILLAAFVVPDINQLKNMALSIVILVGIHIGHFVDYLIRKQYMGESRNLMEGLGFANKAAVSLIFIVVCSALVNMFSDYSNMNVTIAVLTLVVVRTFFDLRAFINPQS
jgi:hypothetical protein